MDNLYEKNKMQVEEEYKACKIQVDSLPTNLEILVSAECNLNCFMCSFGTYKKKFPINIPSDIYKRIEVLYPYLEILKLNGAEIFSAPEDENNLVDKILSDSLQFKNMKLAGITNGLLIGKQRAEIIVEKFDRLEMPIDSSKEDIYQSIRIGSNLENLVNNINQINNLKKARGLKSSDSPHLNFSVIVMERTYKDIPALINFLADLGGNSIGFRPLYCDLKEPEWIKIKNEDIFTDRQKVQEWRSISKEAQKIAKARGIEFNDTTILRIDEIYPELVDDSEFGTEPDNNNMETCKSPWDSVYIGSKGYVSFALCSNLIIGDLSQMKFKDIWNGKTAQAERKKIVKGNYINCSSNCAKNYSYAGAVVQSENLITKIKRLF
ncbi:SPASM domain-containing protein [Candidatus Poribacteria bacterium]|nr:SPASM domain-containing protein [Candidatus Poribacteria bacterium]